MFQQRGFTKRALLAASALCAFSATAAWPQQAGRTPESSANFKFECDNAAVCAQSNSQREKVALAELDAVRKWFDEMEYPKSLLPPGKNFPQGKIITIIGPTGGCETEEAFACVREDTVNSTSGKPAYFMIRVNTLTGDLDTLRETLAHESAHTTILINYRYKWLNEALSEAVGLRWMAKNYGRPFPEIHPTYPMDLNKTFSKGGWGGYEKAPYFGFLASKIGGGVEPFKNLAPFFQNWFPTGDTYYMRGLYDSKFVPEHAKFSKIFPEFIAKYNNMEEMIPTVYKDEYDSSGNIIRSPAVSARRYYSPIHVGNLPILQVGSKYNHTLKFEVEPFSAHAVLPNIKISDDPSIKEVDRLAVVRHEISKAPRINDTSLIFEHELTSDRRHSYLALLDSSFKDTGFMRITNAGDDFRKTSEQEVELDLNIDPVSFEIPPCIKSGSPANFKLNGASAADVSNFRLEASAGRFDGLTYHPPSSEQEVTFHVVIESPITRAKIGIAPVKQPDRKVELGKQKLRKNACSIKMSINNSKNESAIAIQDFDREFTEFQADKNSFLYVRRDEMIAKTKGKWSPPLSGPMVSMIFNQMPMGSGALRGLLANVPGGRGTSAMGFFSTIPAMTTETFTREMIVRMLGDEQMKPTLVTCPDGAGECEQYSGRSQNHSVTAIYNTQNQLVGLQIDRERMTFEYNVPTEDIPPGWGTLSPGSRPNS